MNVSKYTTCFHGKLSKFTCCAFVLFDTFNCFFQEIFRKIFGNLKFNGIIVETLTSDLKN